MKREAIKRIGSVDGANMCWNPFKIQIKKGDIGGYIAYAVGEPGNEEIMSDRNLSNLWVRLMNKFLDTDAIAKASKGGGC